MQNTLAFALADLSDYFEWWQFPLLLVVIGLVVFLWWNKRKQM